MTRKIENVKWKANDRDGKEIDESLATALKSLLLMKDPQQMPKGLDKFRLYGQLTKAFDKAEETGTIVLEEHPYNFLKSIIEKDMPALWGTNKNISSAIEKFLEATGDKETE